MNDNNINKLNSTNSENLDTVINVYSLKKDVGKVILIAFFFVLIYVALYIYNNNTSCLDDFAKYLSGFVIE